MNHCMIPERQPAGPYLSFQSFASGRHATLEDDGFSAWLYLTSQSEYRMTADCFVYSRVEPSDYRIMPHGEEGPPLLLRQFATPLAVQRSVCAQDLSLRFSPDGNSAFVFLRGEPWAFAIYDQNYGYSKSLSAAGPFGRPWNEALFQEYFHGIPAV